MTRTRPGHPAGTATPRAGRRAGWSRADRRIAALSTLLGAATLAALGVLAAGGVTWPSTGLAAAWLPGLVAVFALTEGFVIHLHVRRGGHAMSLSEIPMVFSLLTVDPALAVLARVVGGGAGLVLVRRQRGVKLAFNVGLLGVQAAVAAAAFHGLGGTPGQLGGREWLASYAAMFLADATALVLVTAAIALHDDPGEWRRLPAALRGVPLVAIATTIALVSVLAVARNQWAMLLLGLVSVVLYLAYRAYVRQSQGHAQVEGLYAFTRALDGSVDTGDLVHIVLDQARDQLRAETAELIVPASGDQPGTRTRFTGTGQLDTAVLTAGPGDDWWQPALLGAPVLYRPPARGGAGRGEEPVPGPRDGLAVAVPFAEGTAALLVYDSLPDSPDFDADRLRLFQALAGHASMALAKANLVDRLRREALEKEHIALHDALTDLPNRRQFSQLVDAALADGEPLAVVLLDLDRFKEVNDALGHDTGDALLREVGGRLLRWVGEAGTVARLGGDEFAVLLPGHGSAAQVTEFAAEVAREIERTIPLGPLSLNTRASLGAALAPEHGTDAQTLLRRADVAMYAAKGARTGLRVYQPEDDQNTPHRLSLITDLRGAIERRDLLVVFQPKLDPRTGQVTGAEALARWHHPVHGNIPPDEFIPLAEHSGLVRPLTLHVLELALRRCAAWRRAGHDLHVAVNLSANSLLDTTLPDVVARLLSQTGSPASALTLEITESSIMADPAGSRVTLDRLHELGVKLSIDDFGTGYSSLGRLRELPIHEMKIDKSFVQRIAVDHRDRAVVRSAVQLGHALDLAVVAEGVEDQDTYAYLSREGCNLVQGYLVSRPLPPDEFTAWLVSREKSHNVVHRRFTA
ncbi:MAG TPA: EAL domain-containing protein [Pilimelia sp.]|nr:EAL domain-containing protein [Pilimelia sp.]